MSSYTENHHHKYYFEDGNVVFLTRDKTLFRLHKTILKLHSTFFDDLFELDQPTLKDKEGNPLPVEGSSDDNPITSDVQDAELEPVCAVLYDMPLSPASELTVDQAVSLLHASTKFQFESIHNKVKKMLDTAILSQGKRYALAIDCLVDPWILRSYIEICEAVEYRPAEIVDEFAQRKEMDKISRLLTLRESYRTKLLLYAHGSEYFPYPKLTPPPSQACSNCLIYLKQLLLQVISGNGVVDLNSDDVATSPLLQERIMKAIQPPLQHSVNICANCRLKEKAIVAQVLGLEDIESEIKRVMHIAP